MGDEGHDSHRHESSYIGKPSHIRPPSSSPVIAFLTICRHYQRYSFPDHARLGLHDPDWIVFPTILYPDICKDEWTL